MEGVVREASSFALSSSASLASNLMNFACIAARFDRATDIAACL